MGRKRNADGGRVGAIVNAVREFGIDVEGCRRLAASPDETPWGEPVPEPTVRSHLRSLGVDPGTLTDEDFRLAGVAIRDAQAARFARLEEENDTPGRRLINVVRGHPQLDPQMNESHPLNAARRRQAQVPAATRREKETVMSTQTVFQVTKKAAVRLLEELGFKQAPKYNDARLKERLASLKEAADETKVKDAASLKLLKSLLRAIEEGDDVQVIAEEEAAVEKPKKAKEGKPAKKPKSEEGDGEAEEKPKKAPKAEGNGAAKGPGVIATILARLMKASAKKPVTKDEILDHLKAKFPDRSADSMKSTISHQVPSYLTKAGHKVQKNDGGYWVEG